MEGSIVSCCYGQDPSVWEIPECRVQIMCSTCMAVQGAGINTSLYSTVHGRCSLYFKLFVQK
jgi:hypothetical protein